MATSADAKLRVFDLTSGNELPWSGKYAHVRQLKLAGDRALFAIGDDKVDVYLVDVATGRVLAQRRADLYDTLDVSPDASVFSVETTVTGGSDLAVFKGDGRLLKKLRVRGARSYFSSDGHALVNAVEKDSRATYFECSLEVHPLDGAVTPRRVRIPSSCPRHIAVGRRADRIAWVDVERGSRSSQAYLWVVDKTGAPRRGPPVRTFAVGSIAFDDAEERVAIAGDVAFEVGRITDAKLERRAAVHPQRIVFGPDGTFAEAWRYGIVRHAPSGAAAVEIVGKPLRTEARRVADDGASYVVLEGASARWYARDTGALIGGVLTLGGFQSAVLAGDELTLVSGRGELTVARARDGVALKSFLPMRSSCASYSAGKCVRLAPGLFAHLDESNAHIGHHAKVYLAGPFATDAAPAAVESPLLPGHHAVASDGTFLTIGRGEMAVRNVCASEPWRTVRAPGLTASEVHACPGFAVVTTSDASDKPRRFEAVSTVDGARLGALTSDDGEVPSCNAMRARLAGERGTVGPR